MRNNKTDILAESLFGRREIKNQGSVKSKFQSCYDFFRNTSIQSYCGSKNAEIQMFPLEHDLNYLGIKGAPKTVGSIPARGVPYRQGKKTNQTDHLHTFSMFDLLSLSHISLFFFSKKDGELQPNQTRTGPSERERMGRERVVPCWWSKKGSEQRWLAASRNALSSIASSGPWIDGIGVRVGTLPWRWGRLDHIDRSDPVHAMPQDAVRCGLTPSREHPPLSPIRIRLANPKSSQPQLVLLPL